jgi:predicted ATP-grasp superfamily ATP-dependent carboligase
MDKILILDANQRCALAATRSLGKKGIPVVVADETKKTLAGSSKYCKESFAYPSPYEYLEDFITIIKKECIERNINIIFPMTEITTYLLLKYRTRFPSVNIPFAPFKTFNILTDKWRLFKLAQQLDIPIPLTYFVKTQDDLYYIYPKIKFPVVLKPYRSRIHSNGKWASASVKYANSFKELENIIANTFYFNQHPFLIQEYIQGEGRGIFTLYDQGSPIVFFAHRRLREKPPSGGVSVLSESIEVDPFLKQLSQKILDYVKWHGVAMVEFRVSHDGIPYLMEINARFWGSLQLAIDAGVDFPWLLYQMAINRTIKRINSYRVGIRSRWLLGDFDHLYMKLFKKENGLPPLSYTEKWQAIIYFFNFFERNTRYEVNRLDDLRPFIFELKRYLLGLKT